jgi:hypothetical protein
MTNKTFWLDQLKFKLNDDIAFYEKQIATLSAKKTFLSEPNFPAGLIAAYEIAAERTRRHLNSNIFDYITEDLLEKD